MSSAAREHGPDHSELLCLYALRVLRPSEVVEVETNLSGCEDCRVEMQSIRSVIDSFVAWPTGVLRPSRSLWSRLSERIGADAAESESLAPDRWIEPEWKEVAPGISCQLLSIDPANDRVSMLVRLAPGASYPPHRHAGVEELHLLHGELVVDDKRLHPGDYIRAEAGSADQLVWSETGCTCFLTTSNRDELR
jgi:anti-sigma factor ChrR (cupin superfamily)